MPTFVLTERRARQDGAFDMKKMVVEAEDEQMVKYHWHKCQNEGGGSKRHADKHTYEHHNTGHCVEIANIEKVNQKEADVLGEYLPSLRE